MISHKNVTQHLTLLALRFDMFTSGMGHQRFTDSLRYLIYHMRTDKIFRSQKSCSSLIRFPSGSFRKTHHVQVGVEPHVTCGFQDLIVALFIGYIWWDLKHAGLDSAKTDCFSS
jgi:hypothetical protein